MIYEQITELPESGSSWEELRQRLEGFKERDFDWKAGRLPSYTYYFNEETLEVQRKAYAMFIGENGLGAGRAFPSLSAMQQDIFAMCLPLFHAPEGAGASFTSGGTESVFIITKTARDRARAKRNDAHGTFNIVTSYAAHPCLDKAAHYLGIEIRRTPLSPENSADPVAITAAIDDRTIMIYSSAPSYPHGRIDPITELAEISKSRDLWLHVDACWGGFVSPFATMLGYQLPEWDFAVEGVTSISVDLHKFGYTAKGASLAIYADKALQAYEGFESGNWPRGTYATPTFMGSKPAGSVASTWAVLNYMGRQGYLEATRRTMEATRLLMEGINGIKGLACVDQKLESNLFVYVATDPTIDIMAVADRLEAKGWMRGRMREPLGIHQGVNPAHLDTVEEYIEAVKEAVAHVRSTAATADYDEHSY